MKSKFGTITFLLFSVWSFSQSDSLIIKQLLAYGNQTLQANNLDSTQLLINEIDAIYQAKELAVDLSFLRTRLMEVSMLESRGLRKQAMDVVRQASQKYVELSVPNLGMKSMILHMQAMIENRMGLYEISLKTATQAYEYAMERDSTQDQITISALMAMSSAYFRLYQTETAIKINERVLAMQEKLSAPDHPSIARLLNNLANNYKDLRRYDKALHCLYRALNIQKKNFGADGIDLATTHFNIALNLQSKDVFEEAIEHFLESARITSIYVPGHPYVAEDYQKIGSCQVALGLFDDARASYDLALKIYQDLPKDQYVSEIGLLSAYASLFEHQNDYEAALDHIDKALAMGRDKLGPTHPKLSGYLSDKSRYLIKIGHIVEAKQCVMEALDILGYDDQHFDPGAVTAKDHLYNQLASAGFAHLSAYHQTLDTSQLRSALIYYQRAIQTLDLLRQGLQDENSKHLLSQQSIRVFEHALETAYFLFIATNNASYAEIALQISELSRRSTVLEAILSRQAGRFPGLPFSVLQRERSLQANITTLENQLLEKKTSTDPDNQEVSELGDEIFHKKEEFYVFLDSLEHEYPVYYKHRYVTDPPDLKDLQLGLTAAQCIIEYFDGEQHIYAFSLSRDDLSICRIPRDQELFKCTEQYLTHLTNPDSILSNPASSLEKLGVASHELFHHMLEPALPKSNIKDIVIIPDGLETKLVFDILLSEDPLKKDPRNWPYLFTKYEVHYAQSILAWQEQMQLTQNPSKDFVGFAPNYQALENQSIDTFDNKLFAMIVRDDKINLPGARKEVVNIQQIMPGAVFLGSQATERSFVEHVSPYRILHLSAHTLMDNEFPARSKFLLTPSDDADYDDELTAAEICHLDLSAELAVLSACHTGSGKTNRGEGVMSLGRAFNFAGVPATLISLWRVPDETTSQLMPGFYKALKKGDKKHEALNRARKDYLAATNIGEHRHPYFWGGFVLYGNADALQFYDQKIWLVLTAGLMLFTLMGFVIWKIWRREN